MSLRRIARWVLGFLIGIALLVATSAVVVQTAWFKERLRRIAVTRAAEVLNGELTIGHLGGSLLNGVELRNVVFTQTNGPVVSVESVVVRYDWRLLAKRKFVFQELELRRPVVHVTQRADGWNILHLVKPRPRSGPATAVQFDKLTLVDGTVSVEPSGTPAREFSGVNASLSLRYAGDTTLKVDTLTGREARTGWQISSASGEYHSTAAGQGGTIALRTNAGDVSGRISSSPKGEDRLLDGDVTTTALNLAPMTDRKNLATNLTGHTVFQAVVPPRGFSAATVTFKVDATSATAAGYTGTDVHGTGSFSQGILHMDARANGYGASGTVKGEWRTASAVRSPNSWALSGRVRNLDVRNVPRTLPVPRLATRIAGRYNVNLEPGRWAVSMTLDPSVVEGAELSAGTTGSVESRAGAAPHYTAQGHVTNLDLQRLAVPLDVPTLAEGRFGGRITGDFQVDGRGRGLDDHQLTATAKLADTKIGTTRIPSADLAVSLSARRMTVDFKGPFEHLTHTMVGLNEDMSFDLSGTANARVTFHDVRGPIDVYTVDADGQVALGKSVITGYEIDRGTVDATLMAGAATVRSMSVDGAQLHATAQGLVAFDAEGESNLTFVVDAATLETLGQRIDLPISGAARVEGKIVGPADHLTASGTLASHDVRYGTTVDALTLNGTFTVDVLNRQWRNFKAAGSTDATFLTLGGVEVPHMTAKLAYQGDRLEVDATLEQKDRTLQIGGGLLLDREDREVQLQRLALSTGEMTWSLPAGQQALVKYSNDRIAVSGLALERGAERIAVDGAIRVGGGKPVVAEGVDVRVDNVAVADLNRMLLGKLELTGTITGQAHIAGTTDAPEITSKLQVTKGSVQGTPFDALAADVSYQNAQVTLNATLDQQPGARLTAVGTIPYSISKSTPVDPAASMDVRVESTPIELGVFQPFTDELTALKGTGTFNVRVAGSLEQPRIVGKADVANASFTLGATGMDYMGANASVRFDGDHVTIDQFILRDDDGHTLTAEGGLDLAGGRQLKALDVHVVMNDLHVLHNKLGEVGLDADLKATGELQHLSITGQASVERGRLEVDRILEQFTSSAYTPEGEIPSPGSTETGLAPGSIFDSAAINVRLEMPDNLVLRAQDLRTGNSPVSLGGSNLTLGGVVNITKAPGQNLAVIGAVQAVRGFYEFQGRRFEVQRESEVRFHGEQPIDPTLNVSAEREISGVTAQVNVRGTMRDPTIRLSSTPPLDEADILSLIVFNQPMNQLGDSQRVNLAERAGALAAGALATPLARSIGRALDLDLFEIRAAGENGAGPGFALGRQVGDRLFIGLRQEFGREDMSAVSFEYRISSLLRLVTSIAQGAQQTHRTRRNDPTGMDLIFVIRY